MISFVMIRDDSVLIITSEQSRFPIACDYSFNSYEGIGCRAIARTQATASTRKAGD